MVKGLVDHRPLALTARARMAAAGAGVQAPAAATAAAVGTATMAAVRAAMGTAAMGRTATATAAIRFLARAAIIAASPRLMSAGSMGLPLMRAGAGSAFGSGRVMRFGWSGRFARGSRGGMGGARGRHRRAELRQNFLEHCQV
jgi:hypothetical protein